MGDTSIRITRCTFRAPTAERAIYSQIELGVARQGLGIWETLAGVRQTKAASDFSSIDFKWPTEAEVPEWVDMAAVEQALRLYFSRVVEPQVQVLGKALPAEVEIPMRVAYPCEDRADGGWQIADPGGIPC